MEQPLHSIRAQQTSWFSTNRLVALAASTAIVMGFGWALSVGLAQTLIEKQFDVLKAEVVQEKLPDKPPPPPPPEMKEPPPPFVPPPEITIETPAATNTTAIQTTQSHVASAPQVIYTANPTPRGSRRSCDDLYPSVSQRLGEEGITQLAFTVTADGDVTNPSVAKSSGSERLDAAAMDCIVRWHWNPAKNAAGQPVDKRIALNIKWQLKNQ
jgi:protein TonB